MLDLALVCALIFIFSLCYVPHVHVFYDPFFFFFGAKDVVLLQLKDGIWDTSQTMRIMKSAKLLDEQNAKLKSTMLCTLAT